MTCRENSSRPFTISSGRAEEAGQMGSREVLGQVMGDPPRGFRNAILPGA